MNRVLVILLLLVLGLWAAAQFFHACVLYLAVDPPTVRHPADLGCWIDRGGIVLAAGGSIRAPYGHTFYFEFARPRWNRLLPGNLAWNRFEVYVPFWLAALASAMLLAVRWWLTRWGWRRGFEVKTNSVTP